MPERRARPASPRPRRRRRSRRVAYGFDIVAVRIEDEGAVIIRMINRAQRPRALVCRAGRHGGGIEGVDRRTRACFEGDVQPPEQRLPGAYPELRPSFAPEAGI